MLSASTNTTPTRLAGLDGLRGIAVAAMVTYHLWPGALPGAFVSLPLFFALSGYLITRVLLQEIERTRTVTLRRFWGRRARRLMPASLVTLGLVATIWTAAGWLTDGVRNDLVWSALQGANWRHVAQSTVYGVNPESSPVMHFWSLSIEEQYYLAIPVIVLIARTQRRVLWSMSAILAISVLATIVWWGDPVMTYFSTLTRAGELAAGGIAGALSVGRRTSGHDGGWRAGALTLVGLGGLTVLTLGTSFDMPMYSRGGLLLAGVLSALACSNAVNSPRIGALLDFAPLARLGTLSYGIYLVHWPLLVSLRHAGVDATWAPWITVALTPLLAFASDHLIERPVRERRRLVTVKRGYAAALTGMVVLVSALIVAPVATPLFEPVSASKLAAARLEVLRASENTVSIVAVDDVPPLIPLIDEDDSQVIRSVWVSDSKGLGMVLGIPTTDRHKITSWFTQMGCPVGRGGVVRSATTGTAQWTTAEKGCEWDRWIESSLPTEGVDVAIVAFGTWDIAERRISQLGDRWTGMGDPAYEAWLVDEIRALTMELLDAGAEQVAWLTLSFDPAQGPREKVDRYNEMIAAVAAERQDRVRVIDLAGWIESTGEADRLFPDGVHATYEPDGGTAAEIAERFLFGEIERAVGP